MVEEKRTIIERSEGVRVVREDIDRVEVNLRENI